MIIITVIKFIQQVHLCMSRACSSNISYNAKSSSKYRLHSNSSFYSSKYSIFWYVSYLPMVIFRWAFVILTIDIDKKKFSPILIHLAFLCLLKLYGKAKYFSCAIRTLPIGLIHMSARITILHFILCFECFSSICCHA